MSQIIVELTLTELVTLLHDLRAARNAQERQAEELTGAIHFLAGKLAGSDTRETSGASTERST